MIEPVTDANLDDVLPLIRAYQGFYGVADIDDQRNRAFFSRFGEATEAGCQFLYRAADHRAVAFATVYFTFVSSLPAKVAVMSDLYTAPSYRGRGIGRQLIEHCLDFALSRGAARLQWLTAADNVRAQRLYDTLNTRNTTWQVYTYTR